MPLKPHPTDPDKMVYVVRKYDIPHTWIKTEDKLPEHGQRVLALAKNDFLPHTSTFFTDKWVTSAGYTIHDTTQTYDLWQPIPTRE